MPEKQAVSRTQKKSVQNAILKKSKKIEFYFKGDYFNTHLNTQMYQQKANFIHLNGKFYFIFF